MTDSGTERLPGLRPARQRGELEIANAVTDKIAGRAASEVPGVEVRGATGLRGLIHRGDPDVDSETDGSTVTIHVTVAMDYPLPVFDTAARIRDQVARRLAELTGTNAVQVDVDVAELVPPGAQRAPRMR